MNGHEQGHGGSREMDMAAPGRGKEVTLIKAEATGGHMGQGRRSLDSLGSPLAGPWRGHGRTEGDPSPNPAWPGGPGLILALCHCSLTHCS